LFHIYIYSNKFSNRLTVFQRPLINAGVTSCKGRNRPVARI